MRVYVRQPEGAKLIQRDRIVELTRQAASAVNKAAEPARRRALALWEGARIEAVQIIDLERWKAAEDLKSRVLAISWPRAGVVAATLTVMIAAGWMLVLPRGIQAHPPPLPTETELQVVADAAKFYQAERSRSMSQAHQPVSQGTRP